MFLVVRALGLGVLESLGMGGATIGVAFRLVSDFQPQLAGAKDLELRISKTRGINIYVSHTAEVH